MDHRDDGVGRGALRPAFLGRAARGLVQFEDRLVIEEGEVAQHRRGRDVVRVQQELVQGEGRRHRGVQPHVLVAALGLPELLTVGAQQQRRRHAVGAMPGGLAHQFGADRDVAPLVRPAQLQRAVVIEVQAQEVVGLQQHVGELGEREAHVVTVESTLHGVLGDHLVDGEVLTHVAQEVGQRHRRQPVGVVQQQRLGCPRRR